MPSIQSCLGKRNRMQLKHLPFCTHKHIYSCTDRLLVIINSESIVTSQGYRFCSAQNLLAPSLVSQLGQLCHKSQTASAHLGWQTRVSLPSQLAERHQPCFSQDQYKISLSTVWLLHAASFCSEPLCQKHMQEL